ncbi:MAG: hypothetical protein IKV98_04435 [Clostridia bacterium]|nr:hypothetical protein [Clostridia bacterium]
MTVKENNALLLEKLSFYINMCPDAISKADVKQTAADCNTSSEEAFKILLAGALDLYGNKELLNNYLRAPGTVKLLDAKKYQKDPYYSNIRFDNINSGSWSMQTKKYKPYELFVYNDLEELPDGKILPRVGFFDREFPFPCILQGDREWMTVTPNEIETMKEPVSLAHGRVATYGLGLGYFAYMVSNKPEVTSITIVEADKEAISLFEKHILPQFPNRGKINVCHTDALLFASDQKTKANSDYDFIFADIWHDASDGLDIYRILKPLERPDTMYSYWIEKTLKCYM